MGKNITVERPRCPRCGSHDVRCRLTTKKWVCRSCAKIFKVPDFKGKEK